MHPDRVAYRYNLLGEGDKQNVGLLLGALTQVESGLGGATPAPAPTPTPALELAAKTPEAPATPAPQPKRARTSGPASVQGQRHSLLEAIKVAKPSPVKTQSLAAVFGSSRPLEVQAGAASTSEQPTTPTALAVEPETAEVPATAALAAKYEIPDMFQEAPAATPAPAQAPTQLQIPAMFTETLDVTPSKKAPTPISTKTPSKQGLFGVMGLAGELDAELSKAIHKCSPRPSRPVDAKKILSESSGPPQLSCDAGLSL